MGKSEIKFSGKKLKNWVFCVINIFIHKKELCIRILRFPKRKKNKF